jgi:type I restriction enzyme, S subunit
LTLSAITRGIFDSNSSKLAPFVTEPPNKKRVCSEDFLICRGNGNLAMVGRGRFPPHDAPDCVFPDTMIAARVKPEMISKQFLEALWESPALRKQIEASAHTTNGTHKINQGVIEEMEIPLPPLPLQQKFAVLVERVERLRAVQREALRQAEHLFASLLHRAFSG